MLLCKVCHYFLTVALDIILICVQTFQSDQRPHCSNHGQGGALEQLAVVAKCICPDLDPDQVKQSKTKVIPTNVPINAMAPPEKQC